MKPLHIILSVVAGAIAGAATGLLLAPESGSDTRAAIADYVSKKWKHLSKRDVHAIAEELAEELEK